MATVLEIRTGDSMDVGSFLAALALGFVCGAIARALIPHDAFQAMSGWKSWAVSTALGLLGALVGYFIFTELLNIGDEDKFDWGGVLGALIGSVIVVARFVADQAIRGTLPRRQTGEGRSRGRRCQEPVFSTGSSADARRLRSSTRRDSALPVTGDRHRLGSSGVGSWIRFSTCSFRREHAERQRRRADLRNPSEAAHRVLSIIGIELILSTDAEEHPPDCRRADQAPAAKTEAVRAHRPDRHVPHRRVAERTVVEHVTA